MVFSSIVAPINTKGRTTQAWDSSSLWLSPDIIMGGYIEIMVFTIQMVSSPLT